MLCKTTYQIKYCFGTFATTKHPFTAACRKLRNEQINDLNCSQNIIRLNKTKIMGWAGHEARMRERKGVYRVLVGREREEKRTFGKTQT
jgi:hypothetical protein